MILGLTLWDWVALAVYFCIVLGIGIWTARRVANTSDFFIGGRRFGKVMMVFSLSAREQAATTP